MIKNPTVLVLMSTYNGEKYIIEQINSILNQRNVEVVLFIRDDGSSDATIDILNLYHKNNDNIQIFLENNIGCKKSFYKLLYYAQKADKYFDYYAFSDQDDIWLEDKLISAVSELNNYSEKFKFYSSAATKVDNKLNELSEQRKYKNQTFGNNIISSHILGCTSVFSHGLMQICANCYELAIDMEDTSLPYHDGFISLLAFATNSKMIFDDKSHILYRQHTSNLVGGKHKSIFAALTERFRSNNSRFSKIRFLLKSIDNQLIVRENLELLIKCATSNKSITDRLKLLCDKRLRGDDLKHTLFFWINILLNKW